MASVPHILKLSWIISTQSKIYTRIYKSIGYLRYFRKKREKVRETSGEYNIIFPKGTLLATRPGVGVVKKGVF